MAELAVPIPMTPRVFYSDTALSQNKAKMDSIGKTFYKEIKQAEVGWKFTLSQRAFKARKQYVAAGGTYESDGIPLHLGGCMRPANQPLWDECFKATGATALLT